MQIITYCPPSPQNHNLHFDKGQFGSRRQYPVEAHYVGHGDWASTGIDFDSYRRMGVEQRKTRGDRRLPTPAYALNEQKLRETVIRYIEIRAGLLHRKLPYTLEQRMLIASHLLKVRAEKEMKRVDALSHDYVALRSQPVSSENEQQLKVLQRRIAELDTSIRLSREPWVIPTIVRLYYHGTMDAVGVANEVGFKHAHVRQILYRLSSLADKMEADVLQQQHAS